MSRKVDGSPRGGRCTNGCCPNGIYSSRTHKSDKIFYRDHNIESHRHGHRVGLLPSLRGGKSGWMDLAYNYITIRGPTNSATLFIYLKEVSEEYNRKTLAPESIMQLSQVLMRSPLFTKVGIEKQVSPINAARGVGSEYPFPLWDIEDVDEVALRIHSATHKRSVKRIPNILRTALKKLEVCE